MSRTITYTLTYTFISDSGHGWLKVPLDELKHLGIADKISPYSYANGDSEEDLDAGTFINAKGGINNVPYRSDYHDGACYVRNYAGFPSMENWKENLRQGVK